MGALALAATLAPITTSSSAASAESALALPFGGQLVRVTTPGAGAKTLLNGLGLDLTEHAGPRFVEVLLHTPLEKAVLDLSGLDYSVKIPNVAKRGAQINALDDAYAARVARSPLPSGNTAYRTLDEYNADMLALVKRYPKLAKSVTAPYRSVDGKQVFGIEIGSDVTRAPSGRPTFFIMGAHHAREWPSGENTMEFAVDLLTSYGKDKRITGLLDRARVLVVPIVNVDGFDLSRTDGELLDLRAFNEYDPTGLLSVGATPGQAYRRKNCRIDFLDVPDSTCALQLTTPAGFGVGVDLNRNYAGFWGGPGAAAQVPNPANVEAGFLDPTYRGTAPFSEPETQNIRDLTASRQVTMLITNHTSGDLILRPNGVNPKTVGPGNQPVGDAPDEKGLKELGARMAAQNGYSNQHGWELYDTTGTTEDWSYNTTSGYGYTFEIGPDEFHPPFEDVVGQYLGAGKYAGKGNREAYLIALEHAVSTKYNGVLTGRARPGAVVRLTKTFKTPTWDGTYDDAISSFVKVPRSGSFSWIVNPSTRPLVDKAGGRESYTMTCSIGGTVRLTQKVFIARGQSKALNLKKCR